jgi:predicted Zn-dependent protease
MNDSGAFPYLRSHPLTVERISEARARLTAAGGIGGADALEHQLMGARARVLMDGRAPSLRRLQDRLDGDQFVGTSALSADGRLAVLYAGALAAIKLNEAAPAEAALAKAAQLLRERSPAAPAADTAFALLKAEVLLHAGDAARATRTLDALPQPPPRAALLLRASAALAAQRAGTPAAAADLQHSVDAVQSWVALNRDAATAWELLGRCA